MAPDGKGGAAIPLSDPVFLAIADDAAIRRTAANGVPGTPMPAFAQSAGGMLTDKQIDAIVGGIRSWAKPDVLQRRNSPALYCASLRRSRATAPKCTRRTARPVMARMAGEARKASSIVDGSYLALVSDQNLRTVVIVGRPELGAPDWRNNVPGKPMSAQEISDVVAWLAAQRPRFPGQPYPEPVRGHRDESNSMTTLNWTVKTRAARQDRTAVQRNRRCDSGRADRALSSVAGYSRAEARLRVVALAWRTGTVSRGSDPARHLSKSRCQSLGRPNRGYSLLGQKRGRTEFPGLCDQLRAPGMSGALVPAVEPLHVSVPRRRLLSGWFARRRTSAARTVPVPLQGRGRKALHQGAVKCRQPGARPRSTNGERPPCA